MLVATRRTATALCLGGLALALTGCDIGAGAQSALSIKLSDSGYVVASCESDPAQVRLVEIEPADSDASRQDDVAEASVTPAVILHQGDQLDLSLLQFDRIVDADAASGSWLWVALYAQSDRLGKRLEAVFDVPEAGLSTTLWLHNDGTVADRPC